MKAQREGRIRAKQGCSHFRPQAGRMRKFIKRGNRHKEGKKMATFMKVWLARMRQKRSWAWVCNLIWDKLILFQCMMPQPTSKIARKVPTAFYSSIKHKVKFSNRPEILTEGRSSLGVNGTINPTKLTDNIKIYTTKAPLISQKKKSVKFKTTPSGAIWPWSRMPWPRPTLSGFRILVEKNQALIRTVPCSIRQKLSQIVHLLNHECSQKLLKLYQR